MASIEVYRGSGDKPGAPVVEPLLADNVLTDRGRAEMDRNAHRLQSIEADVLFRQNLRIGQLVDLDDPSQATPRRGKVTGVSIVAGNGRIDCSLSILEPTP